MPHILQAINELRSLISQGAGENALALRAGRAVLAKLRADYPDGTGYVKEKIPALEKDLVVWFSLNRWSQDGRTRESSHVDLEQDLNKLERALRFAHGDYKYSP